MTKETSRKINAGTVASDLPSVPSGKASGGAVSSPAEDGSRRAATKVKAAKPGKAVKTVKNGKPAKVAGKEHASKAATAPAKAVKTVKAAKASAKPKRAAKLKTLPKPDKQETAKILNSQVAFEGPLFRVVRDHIVEPGGQESYRDVIRHNGSVVILAVDHTTKKGKKKKDPWVVIERQYRHAAGQFLWELPAGKLDAGEAAIDGAKRELSEETGYQAQKWSPLVEYFASPGFLGESMMVFLAEGLVAGDAHPEEDEQIDFRLVRLSELLEMVDRGKILDGKTLTSVLLYARQLGIKRKS